MTVSPQLNRCPESESSPFATGSILPCAPPSHMSGMCPLADTSRPESTQKRTHGGHEMDTSAPAGVAPKVAKTPRIPELAAIPTNHKHAPMCPRARKKWTHPPGANPIGNPPCMFSTQLATLRRLHPRAGAFAWTNRDDCRRMRGSWRRSWDWCSPPPWRWPRG